MKKPLYFLLIFLFCTLLLKSQHLSPVWVKQFGDSAGEAFFGMNFIQNDNNGNFLISARLDNTYFDTSLVNSSIIAKYSPSGQLLWFVKTDTITNSPISFKNSKQGGSIYVLSFIYGLDSNYYRNFELTKYDSTAQKIWSKRFKYKETLYFPNPSLFGIELNNFEDIFIGWHLRDAHLILPAGDTIPSENIYHIFKYDSSGTFINNYTPFGISYEVKDFKTDNNNNNIHLVQSGFLGAGLMTFDANFNSITSGAQTNTGAANIFTDLDDNVYVTAYQGNNNNHFFLSKYQSMLYSIDWQKHFKGFIDTLPHPQNPSINVVYKTQFGLASIGTYNNNVYVLSSFTHKMEIDGNVFNAIENGLMSFFITKFDDGGNYHWTEVYHTKENITYGLNTDIKFDDNGSLYCGLMFKSEIQIEDSLYQSQGNYNIIFMRLEETGVGIAPVAANDDLNFRVYPNPAQNTITISLNSTINTQEFNIDIFDITGRLVFSRHYYTSAQSFSIDVSKLKKGMYFIRANIGTNSKVEKLLIH